MVNLNKELYLKYRAESKDPIELCYRIFNLEYNKGPIDFIKFTESLKIWLKLNGRGTILHESQALKNYLDTKFAYNK